ncbi:uncharacterized protein LOC114360477 [Ostrinia furnacalis]|uniref:uncharacterized protein LOC114360477 n=1 Tax=Ostrinia furnacalis TaxID=93504 RepID=UPI00103E57D4|nr:uncharacterized protein LOC114360477 [Ostrinia furnacalis]
MTSQRYGRSNPFYYVGLHFSTSKWIDNNVSLDFYFYEYLSNVYKRGFIEMHFKLCNLIHKDKFFGAAMKQGKFSQPCPYPPGEYHLYNMTINHLSIPRSFPFNEGRIYCNISYFKRLVAAGYIDMELKEVREGQRLTGVRQLRQQQAVAGAERGTRARAPSNSVTMTTPPLDVCDYVLEGNFAVIDA